MTSNLLLKRKGLIYLWITILKVHVVKLILKTITNRHKIQIQLITINMKRISPVESI